jgi:uncharacterized protein YcfJ
MKKMIATIALALGLSGAAMAGPYDRTDTFNYNARVVSVERIVDYQRGNYRDRQCYRVSNRAGYQHHDHNGAVLGGIIGGVLGNQIGDGDGRTAATIAGAAVGAHYGSRNDGWNRHYRDEDYRVECYRTRAGWVPQRSQYVVSYMLGNQEFRTVTDHNPGSRIQLQISVRSLE